MSKSLTLKNHAKIAFENTPQIPVVDDMSIPFGVDADVQGSEITIPNEVIIDLTTLKDMRWLFSHMDGYRPLTETPFEFAFEEGVGAEATNLDGCFAVDRSEINDDDYLEKIELPDGFGVKATSISQCFWGCSGTKITLPEGFGSVATDINGCFSICDLQSLTLPEGFGKVATNISHCFRGCSGTKITLPEGFGKVATNISSCFSNATSLTSLTLPEGFGSVATDISYCFSVNTWYHKSNLTSLVLPDGFGSAATNVYSCFYGCSKLTTITGNPNFKVSIDFSPCPLTVQSLMNVINGLQTVTTAQKLTIGTTNIAKLSEDQIKVATDKGWTVI